MTKQFLGKATKIVRKEQEKDIERNLGIHKDEVPLYLNLLQMIQLTYPIHHVV